MEQSLPSNIDSEALKLSGDISAIAQAYKQLAITVQNQGKSMEEKDKRIKELEDKYEPKAED